MDLSFGFNLVRASIFLSFCLFLGWCVREEMGEKIGRRSRALI